jgi:hypothetical protein
MFPAAGDRSGERAALGRQLDAGVAKPLAVAPRLLVDVDRGLQRLAPFAERMQVALAVGAAVDDGLDVVAGPGVARAKGAATAEAGIAAAAEPLEHPEPHAGRHRGVVGPADPFSEGAGHGRSPDGLGRLGEALKEAGCVLLVAQHFHAGIGFGELQPMLQHRGDARDRRGARLDQSLHS